MPHRSWLTRHWTIAVVFPCAIMACTKHAAQVVIPVAPPLRIDDVTIIDPTDGSRQSAMSILMRDGVIVTVLPTKEARAGPAMTTIDGAGSFAVPGYNNMHSHALIAERSALLLATMLAEGVTGFRQMSGTPELLKARDDRRLSIGEFAPELLVMPGDLLFPSNAGAPDNARQEVDRQKQQHADFIKIILAPRPAFFAAIREAHRLGLPIAGHLPPDVSPREASDSGFDAIEHFGTGNPFWFECSSNAAALRTVNTNEVTVPWWVMRIPLIGGWAMQRVQRQLINPTANDSPETVAVRQRALDSFDIERCRTLASAFKAHNTWQVPTLVRLRTQERADLPEYDADSALVNMSDDAKTTWRASTAHFHSMPSTMRATFQATYERRGSVVAMWYAEGVPMMTGTDGKGDVPGQALQQEFRELAQAGLPPLKILQMATVDPARFLGRAQHMGRIAPGMVADIVLLSADPLVHVENLGAITGVVHRGAYHSRVTLNLVVRNLRRQS